MKVNGIQVLRDAREIAHAFENETEIACDLETSGLSPFKDKIAVINLYGDKTGALGVFHGRGYVPAEIKALLEDKNRRVTYHNGVSFDIPFLMGAGVNAADPPLFDTLVGAGSVLTTGRRDQRKTLQAEVERRLGVYIKKGADHTSWMNPELDRQQILYCAEDLLHLHALRREQESKAREYSALSGLELEMAVVGSVARFTFNGLPLNIPALDDYKETARKTADQTSVALARKFGPINYNSSTQVLQVLESFGMRPPMRFDAKTKKMRPTTQADMLKGIVSKGVGGLILNKYLHPEEGEDSGDFTARCEGALDALSKIVTFREANKAHTFYDDEWLAKYLSPDGRIHARFWQTGTDTLRFSSSDPNLQQWPKKMRGVIGGEEGMSIVSNDYSQIEVVIAAWLAKDETLLELIASGGDIHSLVASQVLKIPVENVTKMQRQIFKAANFGLIFGGGAEMFMEYALGYGVILSLKESEDIIAGYFRQFKGLARMKASAFEMMRQGRNLIEIRLKSGAVRHLVGSSLKPTTLLNTNVQGNAAAGIKYAILAARKKGLDKMIGAQVHDELVATVPTKWAEEFSLELEKCMMEGMSNIVGCPVRVGRSVGKFWE